MIESYFPHLASTADKYLRFFAEVAERTAALIAQWQAVGWSHGVLNTDNMSILGLTLDYGPMGSWTTTTRALSATTRTITGAMPSISSRTSVCGTWVVCANSLPLAPKEAPKAVLDGYQPMIDRSYRDLMRTKLGLKEDRVEDEALLQELKSLMKVGSRVDYTIFWREGTFSSRSCGQSTGGWGISNPDRFGAWAVRYRERLQREQSRDRGRRARWIASIPDRPP